MTRAPGPAATGVRIAVIGAVLTALVAVTTPAWAAPTLALPPGEPADVWRAAAGLAGVDLAAPDRADVVLEPMGATWQLSVLQDGSVVRSVPVDAPTTDAERAEIAILARALARSLAPATPPTLSLALPTPRQTAPESVPAPVAEIAVAPVPVPQPQPELEVAAAAPTPDIPPEPEPEPEPEVALLPDLDPQRRTPPPTLVPLSLSGGAAFRGGTDPAVTTRLGVDFLAWHPFSLGLEVGFLAPRHVFLKSEERFLPRSFWDLSGGLVAAWAPLRPLRVEVASGVAYRSFTQQGLHVASLAVPYVGAGAEVGFGRWFRAGLRFRVTVDLRRLDLQTSTLETTTLVPVEIGTSLVLRIGGRSDPFTTEPTLTER